MKLTLWTSLALSASLGAGFAWVHHGLRRVLEERNDAFLERKAVELLAVIQGEHPGEAEELESEVRREVSAYEPEGLIVVVHEPGRVWSAPAGPAADRLAALTLEPGPPQTVALTGSRADYRALSAGPRAGGVSIALAIALAETNATLAAFDRRAAGGALAFLVVAVAGGGWLSRQALRPVAGSIRAARQLDPEDLSGRLPLTGAGDELDELAATINNLLDRLAAYHTQATRFTADASHELRGPLAAMRAAIDVVLERPREPDEYRSVLASLGEQCERLTALVNALLLLARADAGELAIDRRPTNLADIAAEVVETFEPLAEERNIRLAAEATGSAMIAGDRERLRQLIINLTDNAIRFTEPGGVVTIRVGMSAGRTFLRVTDTGIGIPPEHLPHLFDRFYQADAARASGGAGLGLSICRWIVQAHGGKICARSTPGEGSEFLAEFPRTD